MLNRVKVLHITALYMVIPSLNKNPIRFQSLLDHGVGHQVSNLRDDIESLCRTQQFLLILFAHHSQCLHLRIPGELEPPVQMLEFLIGCIFLIECFAGSTMGVAADNDIFDMQMRNGIFDRSRNCCSLLVMTIRLYDISDISVDKKIARIGMSDQIGHDSGVTAGDKEDFGTLSFESKFFKTLCICFLMLLFKFFMAFCQFRQLHTASLSVLEVPFIILSTLSLLQSMPRHRHAYLGRLEPLLCPNVFDC